MIEFYEFGLKNRENIEDLKTGLMEED